MKLPFTTDEFLTVFSGYNTSVWPMQILFYVFAFISVFFVIKRIQIEITLIILSFLWLWMGIVYHFIYFTKINPAAYIFALLFIIQGVYFLFLNFKDKIYFKFEKNIYGWTGLVLILFSLFIYPLLNIASGHYYPSSPTFGLPCPTTIFTFGFLLWSVGELPGKILIIPVLWSLIGFSAAFSLGIKEDISLIAACAIMLSLFLLKRKSIRSTTRIGID